MSYQIRVMGDPVLRQEAKSIENIDGRIVQMVDDMVPAMYQAEGIGLAAPQVGIQKRLFVYDIGETLEKKLESIRCYQTQFPPAKQYVLDRVRALAEANGAGAGFQAGEVLFSTRAIGSTDLMQTLFPSP